MAVTVEMVKNELEQYVKEGFINKFETEFNEIILYNTEPKITLDLWLDDHYNNITNVLIYFAYTGYNIMLIDNENNINHIVKLNDLKLHSSISIDINDKEL